MCFYNDDYDWVANTEEVTDGPGDAAVFCFECGEEIAAGQWRRHVFQQEHEACSRCEYEELEEGEEPCVEHDYGESFQCDQCRPCVNLLQAIEAVETDEGCPPNARQPAYGELWTEMSQGDGKRYADRAVQMFPELRLRKQIQSHLKEG